MDTKPPALTLNLCGKGPSSQNESMGPTTSEPLRIALGEHKVVQQGPHDMFSTPHKRSRLYLFMVVIIATFSMISNVGNNTAISIALPTIEREFNAQPSELQWVASVYPLSSGCTLLVWGRLADLHGRKKVYLLGMLWLIGFTLGCGFATNILMLIVFRAMQGIGAAACIPASFGILAKTFPPSRSRSLAFASFAAGAPVGAALGTVISGVLIEKTTTSWRSSFYLLATLNFVCFVAGSLFIDEDVPDPTQDKGVDLIGAFMVTSALVFILFVLGHGESAPNKWATSYIIALLVIGVLFLGIFICWQWNLERIHNLHQRNPHKPKVKLLGMSPPPPIMKLSLWGRAGGRFAAVVIIAFMSWSAFLGWVFWSQLYQQDYKMLSPLHVVVRAISMIVVGLLCNAFVGFMASRTPMVILASIGTAGATIACILMAAINPYATYWTFVFPSMVVSVFGSELAYTAGVLYIAKITLPHEQSLAVAVFQTMAQLGNSFGVTVSTVVFNRVNEGIAAGEDGLRSYQAAQWTNSAFGLCGCLISLLFFWGVGPPGSIKRDYGKQVFINTLSSEDEKTEENGSIASEQSVDNPEA